MRGLIWTFLTIWLALPLEAQTPLYWAIANNDALQTWKLTDPQSLPSPSALPQPLENGLSPQAWSVERGNAEVLDVMIYRGYSLTEVDNQGRNLLFKASQQGRIDLCRKMILAGVPLLQKDHQGASVLHAAVLGPQWALVQYLLANQLACQERTHLGVTPLMLACQAGQTEIAAGLLDWGAVAEDEDYLGRSVLDYARQSPNPDTVTWLESILANPPMTTESNDGAPLP